MAAIICSLKYTFISIILVVLPCITYWNQYYRNKKFCLYGCLFVWCFRPTGEFFAKLQILTLTPHSWTLSSEGSLAYCTYCLQWSSLWNSHLLPSVWQWTCHYVHYLRTRDFFTHIETIQFPSNLDLYSSFMAIKQFFSVQHLPSHGASIYNCHRRGTETLTPFGECLAVNLSLPIFELRSVAAWIRTPTLPHVRQRLQPTAPQPRPLQF